jgi:hypothetical protein
MYNIEVVKVKPFNKQQDTNNVNQHNTSLEWWPRHLHIIGCTIYVLWKKTITLYILRKEQVDIVAQLSF